MNKDTSLLNDCYRISGKYFPVPNSDKGAEAGPQELVAQSDRQKDAGLNASDGVNRASTWGKEGEQFPPDANGKESADESAVFAGARDSSLSINLVSGQIESEHVDRVVPVHSGARSKPKGTKGDVKENRV